MKKILSLVLALVMVLSVCSFASAEEKTVINVYRNIFNCQPDDARVAAIEAAINEYLADKDYQIKMTVVNSGEYGDKANLALANNEINLLWTASWQGVIGTNDLVPNKAVYDITDLLPGTALYGSMDEGQWEGSKYDGRIYFIPVYKDNVEGYGLCYRQDLADKFGWDFTNVTKLADIEPMLEDAFNDGLRYPYLTQKTALFYRWNIDAFDFFTADAETNFFAVDRATNTVVNTLKTPEYAEFCKLMGKWAEMGYLSEDDANKVTTDTTTHTQDWAFTYWTLTPNNDEADGRFEQDVSLKEITKRWAHSTSMLGSCYCVTANSTEEQAKACIDFMGALYTDAKLADLFTFGIEGEDFVYDANGQVDQTIAEGWNQNMWNNVSATILTPEVGAPTNTAELYLKFNGEAEASCAAGFRFDKTPVEAEYAACKALFAEYGFALENGAIAEADVDAELEAYQAALDAAGYQKCFEEFTKQYEDWKTK